MFDVVDKISQTLFLINFENVISYFFTLKLLRDVFEWSIFFHFQPSTIINNYLSLKNLAVSKR